MLVIKGEPSSPGSNITDRTGEEINICLNLLWQSRQVLPFSYRLLILIYSTRTFVTENFNAGIRAG